MSTKSTFDDMNKCELEQSDENETVIKKQKLSDEPQSDLVKVEEIIQTPEESNKSQIKKRKYALVIGYCGEGYFGLQRNPTDKLHRTIEDEIVDCLVKVNAIPQNHADEMFKVCFFSNLI